jgi:AcrR family transcriptional regulator
MIRLVLNDHLYLRDPQDTELGRRILQASVIMIDKLGFEDFTFMKLAQNIGSPEASVYRYFENKQKLLIYLVSWHWQWMNHVSSMRTANIADPLQRVNMLLSVISGKETVSSILNPLLDEAAMRRIVVNEAGKFYLTKQVDKQNREGSYVHYKSFVLRLADEISAIAPKYPYAHSLAGILVEEAGRQHFFARHLPSLTDLENNEQLNAEVGRLLNHILHACLDKYLKKQ